MLRIGGLQAGIRENKPGTGCQSRLQGREYHGTDRISKSAVILIESAGFSQNEVWIRCDERVNNILQFTTADRRDGITFGVVTTEVNGHKAWKDVSGLADHSAKNLIIINSVSSPNGGLSFFKRIPRKRDMGSNVIGVGLINLEPAGEKCVKAGDTLF